MTKRKTFTPAEKCHIFRSYGRGYGVGAIATSLGAGCGRVRAYLDLRGAPIRKQGGSHPELPPLALFGSKRRKQAKTPRPPPVPTREQQEWHREHWPGWRVHDMQRG